MGRIEGKTMKKGRREITGRSKFGKGKRVGDKRCMKREEKKEDWRERREG